MVPLKKGRNGMLKIGEMAQLADTTRRTLLFYDEVGLFCPAKTNAAGYRYYEYSQLYDLLFIRGLRKLGMTVAQIKDLMAQPTPELTPQLVAIQDRLDDQIAELTRIQAVVTQKVSQQTTVTLPLESPVMMYRQRRFFWCSQATASCTEEEVAALFSTFYQQLDDLALMDAGQSGFLTDLPGAEPTGYADAGFRVVKEATMATSARAMPKLEKPAGQFAVIKVENTTPGICRGLERLQRFCRERQLHLSSDLWQLNIGDEVLSEHGGSQYGLLEYLIKN